MAIRPDTHRASALKRRAALLAAAIELVSERGMEGVTHREVARRAGLPPSTTSYFFASIDDLVRAALSEVLDDLTHRLDGMTEQLRSAEIDVDELLAAVVPALLAASRKDVVSQFHVYLAASHNQQWLADVQDLFAALERTVAAMLDAAGVPATRANVRGVIALVDGFQLQRLAEVHQDTAEADLASALRAMLIAGSPA